MIQNPSAYFNCSNCGECCGPVPVNKWELNKIRNVVSKWTRKERERMASQKRDPLTCMFRDMENNTCSIYKDRPEICKMFGYYEGMVCPNNPGHATKSREEGAKRMKEPAGILTLQINWHNLFSKK